MKEREYLKILIEHYRNGVATAVQVRELMRHIQSGNDTETLEELIDNDLLNDDIPDHLRNSSHIEKKLDRLLTEINSRKDSHIPATRKLWKWMPYVAAVIALVSISIFIYTKRISTTAPLQAVKLLKDLAPGGKRATLTLADGRTIILDSANAGQLMVVDGTRISKTANGQLVYENNGGNAGTVQTNTVSIPRGGEYQLLLPDGTKIWLNAATTISYPTRFGGQERKIRLSGEAYLEVAKDPQHPFVVETDKQTVKVLGTHFNVNTYTDRTITTLEEGSVLVSSLRGTKQALTVKPGEQAIYANTLALQPADLESALAWKNGLLFFRDTPLQTMLSEISRWYDVDVEYKGTPPVKILSGGVSRSSNLSAVLRILKLTGVKVTLVSDGNSPKLIIEP